MKLQTAFFIFLLSGVPLVNAESFGLGNLQSNGFGYGADVQGITNINLSTVNNSFCWDGVCGSGNLTSSYVPYVGANKNVDLNDFNLTNIQRLGIGLNTQDINGVLVSNGSIVVRRDAISGQSAIRYNLGNTNKWFIGLDNSGSVGVAPSGSYHIYSYDQSRYLLTASNTTGNIGISSTNPAFSLDVNKTNSVIRIGSGVDNSGTATVLFGHRASSTDVQQKNAIISSAIGDWGRANLHLALNTAQDNSNVSITDSKLMISGSTGNVGIGTVTPSRALDVRGIGNFSGELYVQNGSAVSPWLYNQSFDTTNLTVSYVPYVGASKNIFTGLFNLSTNGTLFVGNITIRDSGIFTNYRNTTFTPNANIGLVSSTTDSNLTQTGAASIALLSSDRPNMTASNTGSGSIFLVNGIGFGLNGINSSASNSGVGSIILLRSGSQNGIFTSTAASSLVIASMGTQLRSRLTAVGAGQDFRGSIAAVNSSASIGGNFNRITFFSPAQASNVSFDVQGNTGGNILEGIVSKGANQSFAVAGTTNYLRTYSNNNNIYATSTTSIFSHSWVSFDNDGEHVINNGDSCFMFGVANMSCTGAYSFLFGKGINNTAPNNFIITLGNASTVVTSQPRVFSVMTGAVGINSTGPQYTLEVNGGTKAFNVSNFLFANGTNVGIGTNNPLYPLEVGVNYSGISAWFQGNISVDDVIFRSKVFDTSKGSALKYVKNASAYKFQNGTINHSAFEYSKVTYTNRRITGYHTVQVDKEVCAPVKKQVEIETYDENGLVNGTTTEEQEVVECPVKKVPEVQPIYQNYQEEGYSLEDEVAILRQSIFEIKSETCAKQPAQWSWCS